MPFKRWLMLIGLMTGLGMLKVAEQTAVCVKAYDLGRQRAAAHQLESDTSWLQTSVIGLASPARLASAVTPDRQEMVAWSTLPNAAPSASRIIRLSQLLGSSDD